MNDFVNKLNSKAQCKRIGLCRKRKGSNIDIGKVKKNRVGDCCSRRIIKEDIENVNKMEAPGTQEIGDTSEKTVDNTFRAENTLKGPKVMKDKIMETESLFLIWKNGCKHAFLYLIDRIKTIHSQSVDIEKFLRHLGVLNIILTHFENDSDMEF